MKPKQTWRFEASTRTVRSVPENHCVVAVREFVDGGSTDSALNIDSVATLIAAAPEMYELLHAIWAKTDPSKDPKTCRAIANLLDQVDETIKAKGA